MIPLFFLLGFKSMEEFAVAMGLTENTSLQPMNLVNKIDVELVKKIADFVKIYEGFESKGYNIGDGKITIGYGTTQWLTPTGTIIRPVRMGDTINEPTALQQLQNFYIPVIPTVNLYLSFGSYKVHPFLLVALLQTLYMTGKGGVSYGFFKNSIALCNGLTDTKKIASIYINETIKTLRSLKGGISYYNKYSLGWSRRVKAAADFIEGNLRPKIWYDKNFNTRF